MNMAWSLKLNPEEVLLRRYLRLALLALDWVLLGFIIFGLVSVLLNIYSYFLIALFLLPFLYYRFRTRKTNSLDLVFERTYIADNALKFNAQYFLEQLLLTAEIKELLLRLGSEQPKFKIVDPEFGDIFAVFLQFCDGDTQNIVRVIEWLRANEMLRVGKRFFWRPKNTKTPVLNMLTRDLTVLARRKHLRLCLAREQEIKEVIEALSSGQHGVLLVGHQGVGLSSVADGLAYAIVSGKVPKFFKHKRLVEINLTLITKGVTISEAKRRLQIIIAEAHSAKNIIFFIDDLGTINAELLEPLFNDSRLYFLGAMDLENYDHRQIFTSVAINEPNFDQTLLMLYPHLFAWEKEYGVTVNYQALAMAFTLSGRYLVDKFLPAKALELLQAAMIKQRDGICSEAAVAAVIAEWKNLPVSRVLEKTDDKLARMEKDIGNLLIGQGDAVSAVCAVLRRANIGLRPNRVISFLFTGPKGVGKSMLAKALAAVYFGDGKTMLRLEMSRCVDLNYLLDTVRRQPYVLVYLNEIEKATPAVLNILQQILIDGHYQNVNFSNTIIVAAGDLMDFSDNVIVFDNLSSEEIVAVARVLMDDIRRVVEAKGISLLVSELGLKTLALAGYSQTAGLHPLRPLLLSRVENVICDWIADGSLKRRDVVVLNEDGTLTAKTI